jgi:hypothetical protein
VRTTRSTCRPASILLAAEIHLGALGLLPPSAPEPAAAEEPTPVQDPAPMTPAPSTASWPISEAPCLAQHQAQDRQHGAHVDHAGRG